MKIDIPIVFGSGVAAALELSQIERFDDGSGWRSRLTLRSHPFGCSDYDCYFNGLEQFAKKLRRMYESLSGTARLGQTYEQEYIEFSMHARGRLTVAGFLAVYGDNTQELKFSFGVDQSYLPPFIAAIESILETVNHAARRH